MTALKRKRGDSDGDAARRRGIPSRIAGHGSQGVCALAGRAGNPGEGVRRFGDFCAEVDAVQLELHRSEEHTSELQSPCNLVCRLLLEQKKKKGRTSGSIHKPIAVAKTQAAIVSTR